MALTLEMLSAMESPYKPPPAVHYPISPWREVVDFSPRAEERLEGMTAVCVDTDDGNDKLPFPMLTKEW